MKVKLAHLQEQGINFVVFFADAPSRTEHARRELLGQLAAKARASGLRVDKSALVITDAGRTGYYGTPDLVKFLVTRGHIPVTHELDL
ncbi:MAG TPA: hypothetical protein PKK50_11825 [Myxococcota bacterium]|nr:hypothetical protein [Myxococcota bacterium]